MWVLHIAAVLRFGVSSLLLIDIIRVIWHLVLFRRYLDILFRHLLGQTQGYRMV